jgi:hypothetical protein
MLCVRVTTLHALLNLKQRVLHVTGILFVGEILRDVGVRQFPAKPRKVPGQKSRCEKKRG